jgi:hypothetical protein
LATVHVVPVNDLLAHDLEGEDCACLVTVEPVMAENGSCGWLIVHNSWDGREHREADQQPVTG